MEFFDMMLLVVVLLFVVNVMRQGLQAVRTREMKFDGLGRKGKITGQLVFYHGLARIASGIIALVAVLLLIAGTESLAVLAFLLGVALYLAPVAAMSVQATRQAAQDRGARDD